MRADHCLTANCQQQSHANMAGAESYTSVDSASVALAYGLLRCSTKASGTPLGSNSQHATCHHPPTKCAPLPKLHFQVPPVGLHRQPPLSSVHSFSKLIPTDTPLFSVYASPCIAHRCHPRPQTNQVPTTTDNCFGFIVQVFTP